ncbi:MAG: hypothetical protein ACYTG0_06340 [Planctomycetota bacterium]|jgi:hypothetical protein
MRTWIVAGVSWLVFAFFSAHTFAEQGPNLVEDPSFEIPKERDQFGLVFAKWSGWKYEGDCSFAVGQVARTGKRSCLLVSGAGAKIRTAQLRDLEPGRYQITAYLRGLDVGTGIWNSTTEFMFDGKYMQLKKNGTFGWTKLTYVADVKEKKQAGPSFGMFAPGYFWIDDVSLVKVGPDVPLTAEPVLGPEEAPIAPPGELTADAVRCPECAYRNNAAWRKCYACGSSLEAEKKVVSGPPVKLVTSFEDKNPFSGGEVVAKHATDGKKALRIDRSYVVMDGPQDWSGYDHLKVDLHVETDDPLELYVEVRDAATRDYWTRVNYMTVAPPGQSTLIIPVKQLYVGEKSRPGRMLMLDAITRLVFSIGEEPKAPLFLDNVRLQRDGSAEGVMFDELHAFDFGPSTSPVIDGFWHITPSTIYSRGRGYGLKDARIWRVFDALQPDPLYQDFICIERGGLAVDVPNGKYRVFVNVDSPSGFWGEYQVYRQRAILAEGKPVVTDEMDFAQFQEKYFRFWNVEDSPADDTFDKYQKAYFREKTFDIEVTDGQLNVDFQGENWGCCVSAVVLFPVARAEEGAAFLEYVEQKRRFYFDNYFKRVLHRPTGDTLRPGAEERRRGYVVFQRDYMQDVYYNDTPRTTEIGGPLRGEAFAGEQEPLTMSLVPLGDLGRVTVTAGDLRGPAGVIPASAIDVGFVSYRISRVTMEGSVYTIRPRLIMPTGSVDVSWDVTRRFWMTVKTAVDAKPGLYKGTLAVKPQQGGAAEVPVEFRVRAGTLDPIDVPAGPWGHSISIPWYGNDPAAATWNQSMMERSLRKMREDGFTTCSGIPSIAYRGFQNGRPVLDFTAADARMKLVKELGFLAVVSYGRGVSGFNAYYQDTGAMNAAGFQDYAEFVKAIYTAIQQHADRQGWIPVYYNLGDEPIGDALTRSAENAEAYRKAFPEGPPLFTAASSFRGSDRADPHFRLSKALHVANWNGHDEASVNLLHEAGSDWAFYNGGNRWTFGDYLYKAAKQFRMKFRISWHWNVVAGDPYYALDCREDDYAWCNSSPDGQLIPAIHFEQLREGLDDYRRLLTAARLAKERAGTPAARAAEELIAKRLAAFELGQRDHDALFGPDDWTKFRAQIGDAIEALRR